MQTIYSIRPVMAVLVSLIAVVLIGFSHKKANLRESWMIIAALIKLGIVISLIPIILKGQVVEYVIGTVLPGLDIVFRVDALGLVFALTASTLWLITTFYTIGYMRSLKEHAQTRFYMFFVIAIAAAIGVAFAGNMFTLFVFYEVLSLCTYPLVIHHQDEEAVKGARRYLGFLLGTSLLFMLPALFLTYSYAGTFDFTAGGILAGTAPDVWLIVIFVLFIFGIAKSALMPFHAWLPAAMVAPTPVSALLHAVAVVNVGVFSVLRVVLYIFGVDLLTDLGLGTVLAYFASFTIIAASIIALRQDNLKRRLAYSTVSQLAYIVLGAALLTASGITGSILHLGIHAFGKITLFFVAGAILVATQKTKVSELDGIGRTMPFSMFAFTVGAISMICVPPAGGFVSKWYLSLGALEANQIPLIIVLVISSLLNAAYFLPIVYAAFFKKPADGTSKGIKEAPTLMVAPLVITSIGVLILFFWPSFLLNLAKMVVAVVT